MGELQSEDCLIFLLSLIYIYFFLEIYPVYLIVPLCFYNPTIMLYKLYCFNILEYFFFLQIFKPTLYCFYNIIRFIFDDDIVDQWLILKKLYSNFYLGEALSYAISKTFS